MRVEIPHRMDCYSRLFLEVVCNPLADRHERVRVCLVVAVPDPTGRDLNNWIGSFAPDDCGPLGLTIVQLRDLFLSQMAFDDAARRALWNHPVWTRLARHIRETSDLVEILES